MHKKSIYLLTALAMVMTSGATSSFANSQGKPMSNQFWWPEKLDLKPLRQHAAESNPMGAEFNYANEFKTLDLKAVKKDIETLMTTSQAAMPASPHGSTETRPLFA